MDSVAPDAAPGPCAGFRVLDFSTMVSGPMAAQSLGDLGADVIKIETLVGDTSRWTGPPERAGINGFFSQNNRNKRAMAVDLKTEAGKGLARQLAQDADVVIENFRPGVADRLGIGYTTLSQNNPGLVYVSISGFGPDGPYAEQPVYDLVIQGMSGVMPVQGENKGRPEMVRSIIADKTAAITAASCALAALLARERNNGQGQHVQVPMVNAYAQLALPDQMPVETFQPKEEGEQISPPDMFRTWECADGYLVGMPIEDRQFRGLCLALGRPDLAEDERFSSMGPRLFNNHLMNELLDPEFSKWPWRELLQKFREHDVPFAPVYALQDFLDDPQVKHNGTVFEAEHPEAGTMRYVRHPGIYPMTPATLRRHPPRHGEHTDEVLGQLGLSGEAIAELRASGVVA